MDTCVARSSKFNQNKAALKCIFYIPIQCKRKKDKKSFFPMSICSLSSFIAMLTGFHKWIHWWATSFLKRNFIFFSFKSISVNFSARVSMNSQMSAAWFWMVKIWSSQWICFTHFPLVSGWATVSLMWDAIHTAKDKNYPVFTTRHAGISIYQDISITPVVIVSLIGSIESNWQMISKMIQSIFNWTKIC